MLTMQGCSFCNGRKTMQRFEESVGGEWRPVPSRCFDGMPEWAVDELRATAVERHPLAFRWADVDCPSCNGAGEYLVEHVACKIF